MKAVNLEQHKTTEDSVERVINGCEKVEDEKGNIRRIYDIDGHKITFINQQETCPIKDRGTVGHIATDSVPVSDIVEQIAGGESSKENGRLNCQKKQAERLEHQATRESELFAVPTTPLGIVESAIYFGATDLDEVRDLMKGDNYSSPEARTVLDGFLASIIVNDKGEIDYFDAPDGAALFLMALLGKKEAQSVVSSKIDSLYEYEQKRKQKIREDAKESLKIYEKEGIEPLPLEKVFLAHSTNRDIKLDDNGRATFYPLGEYSHGFPRSTWHCTANSLVYPHAQEQDGWSDEDDVIICPLKSVLQENNWFEDDGSVNTLENLYGVDCWTCTAPGEPVAIPGIVFKTVKDGQDAPVLRQRNVITLRKKQEYSPEETKQIADFLGDEALQGSIIDFAYMRDRCVRKVVDDDFDIEEEYFDEPSFDGHGMQSRDLDQRLQATAGVLGLRSSKHFETPEYYVEMDAWGVTNKYTNNITAISQLDLKITSKAPLNALRYLVLSGGVPSINLADFEEKEKREYERSGNFT